MKKILKFAMLAVWLAFFASVVAYNLPQTRLWTEWQVAKIQAQIKYSLNPPEEAVFVPEAAAQEGETVVTPIPPSATLPPTIIPTNTAIEVGPTPTPEPTATATPEPTPLPVAITLQGVRYEDQHGKWSYCAPVNLSMLLSYWDWEGDREDTGPILKPYDRDKNVMLYEMENYIEEQTELAAVVRVNGTLELLKAFLAEGFPVLVERGVYERDFHGVITWMGHYQVLTGYNDQADYFLAQDSYTTPNLQVDSQELYDGWRSFNYAYIVAYPAEREAEVMSILGPDAEEEQNYFAALDRAGDDILTQEDQQLFFAYFNRGSNLVNLQDYFGAAQAYDQAFSHYADLPENERPWRMMWYQTGPYFAYFYSGRYQDVINLADNTLEIMSEPILEETYYWRAQAKWALGDANGAVEDFRKSLEYHPGFPPTVQSAAMLGINL
jgi:Peptidase_C39 like family/Tetratricopeptide repeat